MTTYFQRLDVDGRVMPGIVTRDDGVLVLTGMFDGHPEPVETNDPNTPAYRDWVAAGHAPAPPPVDLVAIKADLTTDINRQAQAIRDLYVTPGGAQAATYLMKQSQALQAQAAQAGADAGKTADQLAQSYPDLANEIGITVDPGTGAPATDLYGVMRAVLAVLAVWLPLNRQVEATRLKTNKAIVAATTAAEAQAAHAAATWPPAPAG